MKNRAIRVWHVGLLLCAGWALLGQSIDIPSKRWGISFGNSSDFSGLRFNWRDSGVVRINGVNVTFWQPRKDNRDAIVNGLSLGLMPGGGEMRGVNLGLLGVGSNRSMTGVNVGLLGAGAGESLVGVTVAGLGAGAGKSITGIMIGGLGAGAGKNLTGIGIGGLGIGAGDQVTGIVVGGLAAGAGERITGLAIAGLAVGSPEIRGVAIAGLVVGGRILSGLQIAGGSVWVEREGRLAGVAISPFNNIRGRQQGLCIGIVNYARSVRGLQIGLVNIIRDNPRGLKVLPLFNAGF